MTVPNARLTIKIAVVGIVITESFLSQTYVIHVIGHLEENEIEFISILAVQ